MKKYKTAQEIFNESNLVFVKKSDFDTIFPEIKDINVEVKNCLGDPKTRHYIKDNLNKYIDCNNTLCRNGGVEIESIIRDMCSKKETHCKTLGICVGWESMGRNQQRGCAISYDIVINIEYKE